MARQDREVENTLDEIRSILNRGKEAELKEWRLKRSRKIERPAYHVFSDATLRELARAMPQTVEELREVRGIGPGKVDDFGSELLEFLKELSESTTTAAT